MIALNLLPPKEKKDLVDERGQRFIVFLGLSVLFFYLIFIGLAFSIWLDLKIQSDAAQASLESLQQSDNNSSAKQQKLVRDLNAKLNKIDSFQKNHKYYSKILIGLADLTNEGIKIDSISIDEKNVVSLTGFANFRENLLTFSGALEKSDLFANVVTPISSLTRQTNINFILTFIIRPEVLLR